MAKYIGQLSRIGLSLAGGIFAGFLIYHYLHPFTDSLSHNHPVLAAPSASLSWDLLGRAGGFGFDKDMRYVPRLIPAEVRASDGTQIRLKGFVVTLHPQEAFTHFLLVPFPPSCPYCVSAPATQIVEVRSQAPIFYSDAAVLVSGQFAINDNFSDIYYSLEDAHVITE